MTLKRQLATMLIAAAALTSGPVPAKDLVREFKGERPMQTSEFEVEAPWILDWRVTGEFAEEMAVDVSLVQSEFNIHEGNVLKARAPGNGVRLFREGGRFLFRVDSTFANWTLRVYELTPEEAELYTPKNPSLLDY